MKLAYFGKAKHMTIKEIWLTLKFGRSLEPLEMVDFSWN